MKLVYSPYISHFSYSTLQIKKKKVINGIRWVKLLIFKTLNFSIFFKVLRWVLKKTIYNLLYFNGLIVLIIQ